MKKMIRGISVFLTVCLLLSVTGISALAEAPEDEAGTEEQQPAPPDVSVAVVAADAPAAEASAAVCFVR